MMSDDHWLKNLYLVGVHYFSCMALLVQGKRIPCKEPLRMAVLWLGNSFSIESLQNESERFYRCLVKISDQSRFSLKVLETILPLNIKSFVIHIEGFMDSSVSPKKKPSSKN